MNLFKKTKPESPGKQHLKAKEKLQAATSTAVKGSNNSFYIWVYCQFRIKCLFRMTALFCFKSINVCRENPERPLLNLTLCNSTVIQASLSRSLFSAVILHYFHRGTWNSNGTVNKNCQQLLLLGKGGTWNEPQCPFQPCRGAADDDVNSKEINVITVVSCDRKTTEKKKCISLHTNVCW